MSLLSQASLCVTPNAYKEGKLYSVIPSDGSGDMSVTRATTATRVNSAGLVELVPYNLVGYSEQFDNAYWSKSGTTITANNSISPSGIQDADKITPISTGISKWVERAFPTTVGIAYTNTCFVKSDGFNWVILHHIDGNVGAWFNVSNGTIGTITSGCTATIENYGNGWYRCSVTKVVNGSTGYNVTQLADANNSTNATASGSNGLLIWGAQAVEGSTALPYQKTETRLNIPRLDYSNGTCPSLLVEPQRTNLLTYSSSFDNAGWAKENATSIGNISTSPSGIFDADTITDDSNLSRHIIYQSFSGDLAISRAFSTYAKQNTLRYLVLGVTNSSDVHAYTAIFDLQTGTVTDTKTNGAATISASIENVGNGWYRCSVTGTMTSGTANYFPIIGTSDRPQFTGALLNNNFPIYSGTGKDLLIWGAQIELGNYQTSYIPTTSASVTRNADVISKTGISSLIGQTEGTLFVDAYVNFDANFTILLSLNNTGSAAFNNSVYLYVTNNTLEAAIWNTPSFTGWSNSSSTLTNGRHKVAVAWKANDYAFYLNGALVGSTTAYSAVPSGMNKIDFGNYYNAYQSDQNFNAAALWQTRLTNDELATLTTI